MDEKLIQFVDHAMDKGVDRATIRQMLLSAGWKEQAIAAVFCTRELDLPIPQPPMANTIRPRIKSESVWPRRARDACLHLLAFGSLYTWTTSLILLCFTYVDFAFPDPAWRTSQAAILETMSVTRAQLAIVIVAFPVFLTLWHFLLGEVRRDPEKGKGATRRALGYLAILVGALTLSVDVITLIYFLLEGQLTIRLILKSFVLFAIAGSLVVYLAFTLRSETNMGTER